MPVLIAYSASLEKIVFKTKLTNTPIWELFVIFVETILM